MALVSIALRGRYEAAFGFAIANTLPRVATVDPYRLDQYEDGDPNDDQLSFEYQKEGEEPTVLNFSSFPFGRGGGSKSVDSIFAPPPSFLEFDQSKTHIVTPVNSDEDEVIERWNTRQTSIRMSGLLIDMDNHNRPSNKVKALKRLFRNNGVIEVSGSAFLDEGITSIFLKSVKIKGLAGFKDTVQYSIEARSIREVGFTLLNPNS